MLDTLADTVTFSTLENSTDARLVPSATRHVSSGCAELLGHGGRGPRQPDFELTPGTGRGRLHTSPTCTDQLAATMQDRAVAVPNVSYLEKAIEPLRLLMVRSLSVSYTHLTLPTKRIV